jgi:DNA (cytosine-5)-methyltransferase 1
VILLGSLFAGIGGFELGLAQALEDSGLAPRVVWQVEIDPWRRAVLARHFPEARRFARVEDQGRSTLAPVDVMCGGFPCQDLSVANADGRGLEGDRSGLWYDFERIASELRPRVVVVENVSALVARGLDRVADGLAALGYDVEGRVVEACEAGLPHRRARLFLVAHSHAIPLREHEQRVSPRRPRGLRDEGDSESAHARDARGRLPQSGVDRGSHVVPRRVDGRPARRGEPRSLREPPFAVSAWSPLHERRLAALGDAVCPDVARLVGERVVEVLR